MEESSSPKTHHTMPLDPQQGLGHLSHRLLHRRLRRLPHGLRVDTHRWFQGEFMGLMLFFLKGPLSQQYFQSRFLINHIRKCVCLPKKRHFCAWQKWVFGKQKRVYNRYTLGFSKVWFFTLSNISLLDAEKHAGIQTMGLTKNQKISYPPGNEKTSPTSNGKFGNSSSQLLLEEDVSFQEGIFSLKNHSSPPRTGVVFPWLTPNLVGKHLWDWDGHFFQQRPRHGKQGEFCCVSLKILDKGAAVDTVTCNQ